MRIERGKSVKVGPPAAEPAAPSASPRPASPPPTAPLAPPGEGGTAAAAKVAVRRMSSIERAAVDTAKARTAVLALEGLGAALGGLERAPPAALPERLVSVARRADSARAELEKAKSGEVSPADRGAIEGAVAALGRGANERLPVVAERVEHARATAAPAQAEKLERGAAALETSLERLLDPAPAEVADTLLPSPASFARAKELLTQRGTPFELKRHELGDGRSVEVLVILPKAGDGLGAVAERLGKIGVSLIFSPRELELLGGRGMYDDSAQRLCLDLESIEAGKLSPVGLHEARHAHYDRRRLAGKPSLFHTKLKAFTNGKISGHSELYTRFMSVEELSTFAKKLRHLEPKVAEGAGAGTIDWELSATTRALIGLDRQTEDVARRMKRAIGGAIAERSPGAVVEALRASGLLALKRPSSFGDTPSLSLKVPGVFVELPMITEAERAALARVHAADERLRAFEADHGLVSRLFHAKEHKALTAELAEAATALLSIADTHANRLLGFASRQADDAGQLLAAIERHQAATTPEARAKSYAAFAAEYAKLASKLALDTQRIDDP